MSVAMDESAEEESQVDDPEVSPCSPVPGSEHSSEPYHQSSKFGSRIGKIQATANRISKPKKC
jgi:hypothetical protein